MVMVAARGACDTSLMNWSTAMPYGCCGVVTYARLRVISASPPQLAVSAAESSSSPQASEPQRERRAGNDRRQATSPTSVVLTSRPLVFGTDGSSHHADHRRRPSDGVWKLARRDPTSASAEVVNIGTKSVLVMRNPA